MTTASADFPLQPLLERWRRLTPDQQAFARGYMGTACDQARAAIEMVETMATFEAVQAKAARHGPPTLRLVQS